MNKIVQEPHASTLMSSIKAAYKFYYKQDISDSDLFGLSGHAFISHFTNGLGPCAPYTWDMKQFNQLVNDNVGLDMFLEQEFINPESEDDIKENLTKVIKNYLDNDDLVLLCSLEYQLITGYNDTHFITTKPWDSPSVTPDLEFNTFDGMKDFLMIFRIKKTAVVDDETKYKTVLEYAKNQIMNPPYMLDSKMGIESYDFALEKLNDENAQGHGLWWTSVVWSESRKIASKFILTLPGFDDIILKQLSDKYFASAELFSDLSDKEKGKKEKVEILKKIKENETQIHGLLSTLKKD